MLSSFWTYFKQHWLVSITASLLADQSSMGLGYDFGAQNAFVSVTGETDVSNKPITARGTWFQKGNSIRAEADVQLDSRQKLWGT